MIARAPVASSVQVSLLLRLPSSHPSCTYAANDLKYKPVVVDSSPYGPSHLTITWLYLFGTFPFSDNKT